MTSVDYSTEEKTKIVIEEPGFYKVIFLNDDKTPMDFVIDVLQRIFKHSASGALEVMLTVHNEGAAVAGIYSYEIAEQKSIETTMMARSAGFPLQIKIEKE